MEDCSICLEPLVPAQNIFPCSNCTTAFHHRCIEKWVYDRAIKQSCPNCRGVIEPENINFKNKTTIWRMYENAVSNFGPQPSFGYIDSTQSSRPNVGEHIHTYTFSVDPEAMQPSGTPPYAFSSDSRLLREYVNHSNIFPRQEEPSSDWHEIWSELGNNEVDLEGQHSANVELFNLAFNGVIVPEYQLSRRYSDDRASDDPEQPTQ